MPGTIATQLHHSLPAAKPAVLSTPGRELYFPKGILPQAAAAKEKGRRHNGLVFGCSILPPLPRPDSRTTDAGGLLMPAERPAAVFLDRDGTLIEDRGYLRGPHEVVFFADTAAALRMLQRRFRLFMVTNQAGVATGRLSQEEVERVNGHVVDVLATHGVRIERTYCCPHQRKDGCGCIKPNPYFLRRAAVEYGIDLAQSWVVGDHPHDVELGARAGCAGGVYLLTGHGRRHLGELTAEVTVMRDIHAAARWILDSSAPVDGCRRGREALPLGARPAVLRPDGASGAELSLLAVPARLPGDGLADATDDRLQRGLHPKGKHACED